MEKERGKTRPKRETRILYIGSKLTSLGLGSVMQDEVKERRRKKVEEGVFSEPARFRVTEKNACLLTNFFPYP